MAPILCFREIAVKDDKGGDQDDNCQNVYCLL